MTNKLEMRRLRIQLANSEWPHAHESNVAQIHVTFGVSALGTTVHNPFFTCGIKYQDKISMGLYFYDPYFINM